MAEMIETTSDRLAVNGSSIRIMRKDTNGRVSNKVGIVSILPAVQIKLGIKLDDFIAALELSRLPLAITKTLQKGRFRAYDIVRLETGAICEEILVSVSVCEGIVIGVTYNRKALSNENFRKLVRLSAMHQVSISGEKSYRLLMATRYVSIVTGVPREKLLVIETLRGIKVKVKEYYADTLVDIPVYYTFKLDKSNRYDLTEVSYDFNEAVRKIKGA